MTDAAAAQLVAAIARIASELQQIRVQLQTIATRTGKER